MPNSRPYLKVQDRVCPECGKNYKAKSSQQLYCGTACNKEAYRSRKAMEAASGAPGALQALPALAVFNPQRANELRAQIFSVARKGVAMAEEVIEGKREWSPSQARVFTALLDKVVPNLSASFSQKEVIHRDHRDMSLADLESLVASYKGSPHAGRDPEGSPARLDHHPGGAGLPPIEGELVGDPRGEALAGPARVHRESDG